MHHRPHCIGISCRYLPLAWLPVVFAVGLTATASAHDLNGAWVTSIDACDKVFVKKGRQTVLAPDADFYGSGFVVDGTTIRGKLATCKITSLREDGQAVHIRAACATDIMLSSNEFVLTRVENDKLVRAFPGIPEMDTPYYRCVR
jgi:hypothetical protein